MAKGPNGKDVSDARKMSGKEMLLKIIGLSSREGITGDELRRALDAATQITPKPS